MHQTRAIQQALKQPCVTFSEIPSLPPQSSTPTALEISRAAENIGISHQQSIPNVPQTHGKIEKRYQQALGSCRAALLQSGLPVSWWPEALSYACIAQGIADKSIVNLQPPTAKAFVLLPFGCRVSVKPADPSMSGPKFESAGKPALFLGWKLQPGLRYRGEMLYCFEDEFSAEGPAKVRSGESIAALNDIVFPIAEARKQAHVQGLVKNLYPDVLPFEPSELDATVDEPGELVTSSEPASSSTDIPIRRSNAEPPPPRQDSQAPAARESAPVGRPATLRPPHWSSSPELTAQWNNFSYKNALS